MEYLVTIGGRPPGQHGGGPVGRQVMLVEAPNRGAAYVVAFDAMTRRGVIMAQEVPDGWDEWTHEEHVAAWEAGLPAQAGETWIISIREYHVRTDGTVRYG